MGKWRTQSNQLPTPMTLSGCAAWECCSNLRLYPIQLTFILYFYFLYSFILALNFVLYCIVLYCYLYKYLYYSRHDELLFQQSLMEI